MNQNFIPKRTNKDISELGKIIHLQPSGKYKSKSIINLYSTLTPTESINQKNILISSNIKNINNNINTIKKNINFNNNTNKISNNINSHIIKKNNQPKNLKYKGSSSSTNIKNNYSIFKTKKLKSTSSLINNNNVNKIGGSIKKSINLPKPKIKNNIVDKSKSKEKMIYSFYDEKNNNLFRKSMSHNKMKFPYSNKKSF